MSKEGHTSMAQAIFFVFRGELLPRDPQLRAVGRAVRRFAIIAVDGIWWFDIFGSPEAPASVAPNVWKTPQTDANAPKLVWAMVGGKWKKVPG